MPIPLSEIISLLKNMCKKESSEKVSNTDLNQRICLFCQKCIGQKHGTYSRHPPIGLSTGVSARQLIQRYFCPACERTFSRLPFCWLPRMGILLISLLIPVLAGASINGLLVEWDVARSTVQRWRLRAQRVIRDLAILLENPKVGWAEISKHFSRSFYKVSSPS